MGLCDPLFKWRNRGPPASDFPVHPGQQSRVRVRASEAAQQKCKGAQSYSWPHLCLGRLELSAEHAIAFPEDSYLIDGPAASWISEHRADPTSRPLIREDLKEELRFHLAHQLVHLKHMN